MERLRYEDFVLKIQKEEDHYIARILHSPAGEASSVFKLPFSDDRLELLVMKIGGHIRSPTRGYSVEMEAAHELGGKLFDTIFSGDVRSCFKSSLNIVYGKKNTGLRLKLMLQEVPELADLPWEFLYDESLNRFIAQSNQTPIIRYIEIPEKKKPLKMSLPLHVLVVTSSPIDYCSLGVENERRSLEKALRPLIDKELVTVKWLESPALSELHHCLMDGEYHVFHFIGHGGFDKKTQEGVLVLEDEKRAGCSVGAHKISTLLHNHPSLRLVVLNSCEGARNSRNDPFSGVAAELVRQRIPAVVAMQFEITDSAAITFSGEFYSAISRGFPVDTALAEARMGIYAGGNEIEWGTPVLYMRSPDGVLFDIKGTLPADITGESNIGSPKIAGSIRDIIVQAPPDSTLAATGTTSSGSVFENIAGKQPEKMAVRPQNAFIGKIINAPGYAKIAGILVLATASLLFFGLPGEQNPSLSISPDPISFSLGNMSIGETAVRTFSISNTGQGILKWNVSADQPWITLSPINGVDSGTVYVNVNTTGLGQGVYSGIIIVDSNGGNKYYGSISLNAAAATSSSAPTFARSAPKLKISQSSFRFDTDSAGELKKTAFRISNAGGGTLEWNLSTDVTWIELNRMSGSNNGSIFITVDPADLSPGKYVGTIMVTSNGGDEQVTIESNVFKPAPTIPQTTVTLSAPAPAPTPPATLTNSIGMEFVLIPAGEFDMGSPSTDTISFENERPVHHVKLSKAFYLGKYEVTQKQWRDVMGTDPSSFKGDDLPVELVSWNDVSQFITKLNAKEGTIRYRLPSEAEWEYAARAGTTTRFSFGDDESKLGDYAWYYDNSNNKTHPVCQKKSNTWGLYDMYGNVWEWVQDKWHDNYNGAPTDGSSWESGIGSLRVFRGSGWDGYATRCRSANRNNYDPGYRNGALGFRLLRDL